MLHNQWCTRIQFMTLFLMHYAIAATYCLHSASHSTLIECPTSYSKDKDTSLSMSTLRLHTPSSIPSETIQSVHMSYRTHLTKGNIFLIRNKLLLFKAIAMNSKILSLTIVPSTIRRTLFDHYRSGPSGGYMGEYKTLYRMHIQFFQPGLREDIEAWVASCTHCISYNAWHTRSSELYFLWPVTVPFWIIHVELWSPGLTKNLDGNKLYMMNCMYNLTQTVISSVTTSIDASTLAYIFTGDVVLSFGMCSVVVINNGSTFKSVFISMYKALKIHNWCLSRGNHRGNSAEHYHIFLNKTEDITGNHRGVKYRRIMSCLNVKGVFLQMLRQLPWSFHFFTNYSYQMIYLSLYLIQDN